MTVLALGNLAAKVEDLDASLGFYSRLGAAVAQPVRWWGARRADVALGPLELTLFERAVYEDPARPLPPGFLHAALFVDDLGTSLAGIEPSWGPEVVEGHFGRRRIAFLEAPGLRLEFMEDLG